MLRLTAKKVENLKVPGFHGDWEASILKLARAARRLGYFARLFMADGAIWDSGLQA